MSSTEPGPRPIDVAYADPVDQIWRACAAGVGLRVTRTAAAYATTDGAGTLALGTADTLDADDSLAQMIFHELCHAAVEGEAAFARVDWGLDNTGAGDCGREHACLRLQWVLAGRHGLRGLLAPTTDFRVAFWDRLDGDVLADRADVSVVAAIAGLARMGRAPFAPHVERALAATAQIALAVGAAGAGSLWARAQPAPAPHPTGLPAGSGAGACGTCAWRYEGGPGRRATRCRQARGARIDDAWPACERFEAALDCQTCGACCREAYHAVQLRKREPFVRLHPDYVVDHGAHRDVRRAGDRCAALAGGEIVDGQRAAYACTLYDTRPETCREFTLGSAHCLAARQRVALSIG